MGLVVDDADGAGSWLDRPWHRQWLTNEASRLLSFSVKARHPNGGFAWMDTSGQPDLERPVLTWVTTRMTHVLAVGHMLGTPGCGSLASHGIIALRTVLADQTHGGWFSATDAPGGGEKRAYEHAFVLLAASSATLAGRPDAEALLSDALGVVERYFWDDERGVVVDVWNRDWSVREPYGGANANMHMVEAFLAAADVTGNRVWLERAVRIASFFIDNAARAQEWRIPEHFDANWSRLPEYGRDEPAHQFRPYGATIGHAFEWSRLCLHLHAALGSTAEGWLVEAARNLYSRAVLDGWQQDGFVYTTDWTGKPVVTDRLHWVVCEAIAAAGALARVTGEKSYEANYQDFWDVAETFFIDRRQGSWYAQLDAANVLAGSVWSGKPDTYHAFQATLLPRLPLAPSLAKAVAAGFLDTK
jgi:sulfoquinovose isomerase